MIRLIERFHQDDDGDWAAELSCLHSQHVRHRPPFQERPWVTSKEDRLARVGAELDCPLCDRLELPAGLELTRTVGPFDQHTLPATMRRAHCVAERTWGRLRVIEGSVVLAIETIPSFSALLAAGQEQPIPPLVAHLVRVDEPMRLVIDFLIRSTPPTS